MPVILGFVGAEVPASVDCHRLRGWLEVCDVEVMRRHWLDRERLELRDRRCLQEWRRAIEGAVGDMVVKFDSEEVYEVGEGRVMSLAGMSK